MHNPFWRSFSRSGWISLVAIFVALAGILPALVRGEDRPPGAAEAKRGHRHHRHHQRHHRHPHRRHHIKFYWRVDSPFQRTRSHRVGTWQGRYATRIVTNGGNDGASACRVATGPRFSYGPGEDVSISAAWYVRNPSRFAYTRFMNLGHYVGGGGGQSGANWYLGLESVGAGTWQVGYAPYGDPHVAVLPPRRIPVDRWVHVVLRFHLSPVDGRALNQWFINGRLVESSTQANMLNGSSLTFYNAGLSYFWPGNGNTTLYFDDPRVKRVG